ncbi:Ssl1-like-domain-containing protein [Lasiosphaeria miniovina]|uniref:General transcription and DNA repair factor IIH n=1 Tax=Lasiosphaeria miniovina TaxID=1954250 RepID=A0AA40AWB2_9PEZI|nr:Ssl1-like-domain-containing protein [Lasiosphaeria miniovina]KAK0723189.1 Ssl1-like-domain-containing protein [Lasiosphaeria miniovina]
MADSDGEYVGDLSDDDLGDHHVTSAADGTYGTRSKAKGGPKQKGGGRKAKNARGKAVWEDIQRSWEDVVEGADGLVSREDHLQAERRARLLRDTTPLQRGIIRHLMLVLDMSFAMAEKDFLPNRYLVTINCAVEFVREYFEQNPISQLGILAMRDGIAVRISDLTGNPAELIEKLREWAEQQEPLGNPSLQNALEMCRGALFHTPSHGTREVLIIYGALMSSDPGDIRDTVTSLIADHIRVTIVGLAAQVAICAELCTRTNGGDESKYAVALHEQHFRELFLSATTPPVTLTTEQSNASLLMMGFPSRTLASRDHVSLCACHNRPSREGYTCTRCRTKVCRLPAECPVCGLTLILSTHLARSYHHLFPLRSWVEVSWADAARSTVCYSCMAPFPIESKARLKGKGKAAAGGDSGAVGSNVPKGVSESGRYACEACGNHFCIDCDMYAHEIIHNCPGCQSDTRDSLALAADGDAEAHGAASHAKGDAMAIDT